jgi:hypothetical protein
MGLEKSVNESFLKTSRPGGFGGDRDDTVAECKSAIEMCQIRHALTIPQDNGMTQEHVPGAFVA